MVLSSDMCNLVNKFSNFVNLFVTGCPGRMTWKGNYHVLYQFTSRIAMLSMCAIPHAVISVIHATILLCIIGFKNVTFN